MSISEKVINLWWPCHLLQTRFSGPKKSLGVFWQTHANTTHCDFVVLDENHLNTLTLPLPSPSLHDYTPPQAVPHKYQRRTCMPIFFRNLAKIHTTEKFSCISKQIISFPCREILDQFVAFGSFCNLCSGSNYFIHKRRISNPTGSINEATLAKFLLFRRADHCILWSQISRWDNERLYFGPAERVLGNMTWNKAGQKRFSQDKKRCVLQLKKVCLWKRLSICSSLVVPLLFPFHCTGQCMVLQESSALLSGIRSGALKLSFTRNNGIRGTSGSTTTHCKVVSSEATVCVVIHLTKKEYSLYCLALRFRRISALAQVLVGYILKWALLLQKITNPLYWWLLSSLGCDGQLSSCSVAIIIQPWCRQECLWRLGSELAWCVVCSFAAFWKKSPNIIGAVSQPPFDATPYQTWTPK